MGPSFMGIRSTGVQNIDYLKGGCPVLDFFLLADRSHQLFNYQVNKSAHCTPHTSLSTASKKTYAATIVSCGHLIVLLSQLN